jgi:hypothetical protein
LQTAVFLYLFVPVLTENFNWRGVRVVEGARLESVYAGNRIAGSNPALSARFDGHVISVAFFIVGRLGWLCQQDSFGMANSHPLLIFTK